MIKMFNIQKYFETEIIIISFITFLIICIIIYTQEIFDLEFPGKRSFDILQTLKTENNNNIIV